MFALCIAFSAAVSGPQEGRGRRICVVAVRDSSLFTMCPSAAQIKTWRYPGRTQSLEIIQNTEGPRLGVSQHLIQLDRPVLDRSRAEWWNIIGKTRGASSSGKIDLSLKIGIEKELSRRSDIRLVDSPEHADLVFLAEGLYADHVSGFIGVQPARSRPTSLPILALVMAIAVPADFYVRVPSDSESLLGARVWEGVEAWKSDPAGIDLLPASVPASLELLVGQFMDSKAHKPDFPPLCAARILAPSVDATGNPRTKAGQGAPAVARPGISVAPLPDNVIRATVSLVTVPTIVTSGDGSQVPNLDAQDFHVFENGVEQQIDRVIPEISPFNVVLMLDTSGSTIFKHSEIQKAALAFVDALRPEDHVMVVSFDSYIYLDSAFTNDHAALRRAILQADTGAGTRLYDALDLVITECLEGVQGKKAIVLFTDGVDSASWAAGMSDSQNRVERSDALVYVVQYDAMVAGPASQYLSSLSGSSGGKLFVASNLSGLSEAFAGIAGELQHQYAICYYPFNQSTDSTLRQIRVTVDRQGTKIRARTGYRITSR